MATGPIDFLDALAMRPALCAIGQRLYARGFSAGNDGNLSVRVSERAVLCTPTLICKGLMTPEDLCIVDLDGAQLEGVRASTSEILLHLEIYKADPRARAVVHCHPPHATAFGVAGELIPTGVLPECEVMLGTVPTAPYETPGTRAFAESIRPLVPGRSAIVLSNHGTVSWAATLERAYWNTEILDASCRILLLAKLLGGVQRLSADKVQTLLDYRERMGEPADERSGKPGEMFVNPRFGSPLG